MISRAALFGVFDNEFKIAEMDAFNKKVNHANFIIGADYLIQRLGKKDALRSVFSLYKLHSSSYIATEEIENKIMNKSG